MIHGWIETAIRFGISAAERDPFHPLSEDEIKEMATWLSKNPTGTHEEYLCSACMRLSK